MADSGKWLLRACWCLAALIEVTPIARAQVVGGTIAGVVRDHTGAARPGATIVVTAVATLASRTTTSDEEGRFVVASLPAGECALEVRLDGFRPLFHPGVLVVTGETVLVDLRLTVSGAADAIIVTAAPPLLRSETPGLGHVVEGRMATALPLNGRSFITLVGLVPGVILPPGSLLPRINGGRPRTNEYLFDGISVLQPEPGQVAFFPNVDAIHELTIESNSPSAEFGRFTGGVVNVTTKSGGNVVRGSAFGFVRHEALNARNFFAPPDSPKPRFRRGQFGGVVGGPVRRDRTFFFADYQGQRQRIGRTMISTVPTLLQRQGVFTEGIGGVVPLIYDPATTASIPTGGFARQAFADNVVPGDRQDLVARRLLARYPLPTATGTANNYRRVGEETVDQDQVALRLDHRAGAKDSVFGRMTHVAERVVPVSPLPDGSGAIGGTPGPQRTTASAFASRHQHVFSARVLHELRVGDTRRAVTRSAAMLESPPSTSLHLPGIPEGGRFSTTVPTVLIAGYQAIGSPANTATDFSTSVTQLANTITWARGGHTVKAGADLRWARLDVVQPPSPTGEFVFSNLFTDLPGVPNTGTPLASFLLGQVQQFSVDVQSDVIQNRAHVQEYFVQDDWRLSDRVTVNLGGRYTLNFPSVEARDRAAVFNLTTQELEYLGRDGHPRSARRLHLGEAGPRLGAAWRAADHTVVRGGYARVFIEQAGITTPFTTPSFPFLQTVSQRTLDNVRPAFALAEGPTVQTVARTSAAGLGQGVFAVDRDQGSGFVQQWHVTLQRALSDRMAVEAGYVGSKGSQIGLPDANLNQLTTEQLALGAALLERVPNPSFGLVPSSSSLGAPTISVAQLLKPYPQYTTVSLYRHNVGTTSYRGAFAKLERRDPRGVSYLVSYTRSRLVDDASSVFDASILTGPVSNAPVADSFNRALDRDHSTGDIPHVLAASGVWVLPFGRGRGRALKGWVGRVFGGWTLTGVLTLQSGAPVAVTQATNNNAFAGFGIQRPNVAGEPALPARERSVTRWFNTAAFAPAPAFVLGTSSRNPVRGPGFRNLDVAFIRHLPGRARQVLELRAEVFNLTNTPPLGAPNGVAGSAAFGSVTTAGDPRVVQVAVKYAF